MSTAAGTRRRQYTAAFADLRDAARNLQAAERTWADVAPGMRAQSLTPATPTAPRQVDDDDLDGSSPIGDPTGQAAIRPSAARRDEAKADELIRNIARATAELAKIMSKWAIDLPLKAEELAALKRQGDPGCEVVGRIERGEGQMHWEPELATTDFHGLLPRPYRLGAWAHKFVQRNGRLPTTAEAKVHCAGRRVMVKV